MGHAGRSESGQGVCFVPHVIDYQKDRMLRSAVERNIESVGEAARHVSEAFHQAHPEIPWKSVIGQGNILAHEYGEVKNEKIWAVATGRIPDERSVEENTHVLTGRGGDVRLEKEAFGISL